MKKKSKVIISIVGTLLFISIIIAGFVSYNVLNNNSRYSFSPVYIKYRDLPNVMQDEVLYISREFFEENEFSFVLHDDMVKLIGFPTLTNLYYIDFTRKVEGIDYYSMYLSRNEGGNKIPIEINIKFYNPKYGAVRYFFKSKEYGGCKYMYDGRRFVYIHANDGSKKYELTVELSFKRGSNHSIDYSVEEQENLFESIVHSLIDNIITYNEIMERGGVWQE